MNFQPHRRFCYWIIYLSIPSLFCAAPCRAQHKGEQIDSLLSRYHDYGEFNGSVLVGVQDSILLKKGYGYADVAQKIPNKPSTRFLIGSVTKVFTDLLVLQQIQKGTLKLDGKIRDYLPDYPMIPGRQVSVYNLLTNTSGIPDYTSNKTLDFNRTYTSSEIMGLVDSIPLQEAPGSRFLYSNSGAFIAGAILEKTMGSSFGNVLIKQITHPLALANTGYRDSSLKFPLAKAYSVFGNEITITKIEDPTIPFSSYGMYSTVEDMNIWNAALYTETLLSKPFADIYFQPYRDRWACEWMIVRNPFGLSTDSTLMTIRAGSISKFTCFDARIVNNKGSIVLMSNMPSTRLEEIVAKLTAILLNKPFSAPRKSLQKEFLHRIEDKGFFAALTETKILAKDTVDYYISASELLQVGFRYWKDRHELPSAIKVFEWISELFPRSFNPYDSELFVGNANVYGLLADAYIANGQTGEARRSLKTALEIDPEDQEAKNTLREIGLK